jgi:hypothetical protein
MPLSISQQMGAALSAANVALDLPVRAKRNACSDSIHAKGGFRRDASQWHGLVLGFTNPTRLKGPSTLQSEPPRRES